MTPRTYKILLAISLAILLFGLGSYLVDQKNTVPEPLEQPSPQYHP